MDQAILKEWLTYDPKTGKFTWAKSRVNGKVQKGQHAGYLNPDGYIRIMLLRKLYYASRLAVLWMTGDMPEFVDHVNRNTADDRWDNLRVCTRSQNQCNHTKHKHNKSGFKGVFWSSKAQKWYAQIGCFGKKTHLGSFDMPEDAAAAYVRAAKELHGDFACTD